MSPLFSLPRRAPRTAAARTPTAALGAVSTPCEGAQLRGSEPRAPPAPAGSAFRGSTARCGGDPRLRAALRPSSDCGRFAGPPRTASSRKLHAGLRSALRGAAQQRVNGSLFPLILIPAWVGGSRCSDLLERKR